MLICVVFYIEFHCVIVYCKRMNEWKELWSTVFLGVTNNYTTCMQIVFLSF